MSKKPVPVEYQYLMQNAQDSASIIAISTLTLQASSNEPSQISDPESGK